MIDTATGLKANFISRDDLIAAKTGGGKAAGHRGCNCYSKGARNRRLRILIPPISPLPFFESQTSNPRQTAFSAKTA